MATTTSPGRTRAGPEQPRGLDDAGGGAGDVVLVGLQQPGVLGRLAADQRAAGLDARLGDALDDGGDPLGDDPAGGDVVGQEQRLGAADDEVVDEHADQVEADGVVLVHRLGDGDLGADAVGRGGQQRPVVALERAGVEEAREAADAADHLGAAGLLDPGLHQLDGLVARLDGDAGGGVRVGHGWLLGQGLFEHGQRRRRTTTTRAGACRAGARRAARWGTSRRSRPAHSRSSACPVASTMPSSEM